MKPIGSGGNTEQPNQPNQPNIYERIAAVDVSKVDTISQELAGISNDVNSKIAEVFSENSDGGVKVTSHESGSLDVIKSYMCNLNYRMKVYKNNVSDEIKTIYNSLIINTSNLIERLTNAVNGENPNELASLEPQDVDSEEIANQPRVPRRMPWGENQEDMKDVYDKLMNPIGRYAAVRNKPMAKISAIEGFIREYRKRLTSDQKLYLSNEINKWLNQVDEEVPTDYFKKWEPDKQRAEKYWQEYKKAGYRNDMVAQLMVYGYSKNDAQKIKDGRS